MNKSNLKAEFIIGYKGIHLEYDGIGMTSGIGHGRFAKGKKEFFKSKEQFFKEIMLSPNSFNGKGVEIWKARTSFEDWVNGLIISKSTIDEIKSWINDTKIEIEKNIQNWNEEDSIDFEYIKFPAIHLNPIQIKETIHPRFWINSYTGFMSESNDSFFFLEEQFES